ncbi:hypothetical protein XMIN_1553 [Xanthomonas citri pv. mangiferaeindicae LMG 941]|nr:hypothetical protein XMIN_1553 [Xanthomonas citri pv. mangiferaeindicae LMG 941]
MHLRLRDAGREQQQRRPQHATTQHGARARRDCGRRTGSVDAFWFVQDWNLHDAPCGMFPSAPP